MDPIASLVELCSILAPSGAESALADHLHGRWKPRCAKIWRDPLGNVVARVGGSGPRLLVEAHMDQVGYLVRYITTDGFLLLDGSQGDRRDGPERRHQVGSFVRVLTRDGSWVEGFLAAASGHVLTSKQREQHRLGYDDFWVEIGLASRQAVLDVGIHVGSPVVFDGHARQVGDLVSGPSMDDRVGLVAIDIMLNDVTSTELSCELWIAATVQEENGLHGARALAFAEHFDAVIALEVGLVSDVPSVDDNEHDNRLGDGPIAVHRDSGIIYDRALTRHLRTLAHDGGLPIQDGVFASYRSDGLAFIESGAPTALLAIPTRYTHTAFETIHPMDLKVTGALLRLLTTNGLPVNCRRRSTH